MFIDAISRPRSPLTKSSRPSEGVSAGRAILALEASSTASPQRPASPQAAPFGVGTYNLAAGNNKPEYSGQAAFDRTKRLAAQQMVSGEVSVLALQEVGVNGRNTRGRDNNEELLTEIFRQELPREFSGADVNKVSLDASGRPVMRDGRPVYDPARYADTRYTATSEAGDSRNMTLTRERYDAQGREIPFSSSAKDGPTVLYSARLEEENKSYNLAFSSNNDEGSYGNSVLLGPGYEIEDVQRRVLGRDPGDNEQRSAVGVTFTTPDGHEATAVSSHLTAGQSREEGEAKIAQHRNLAEFSDGFDNAILLGDYNAYPGRDYGLGRWDFLPWVDPAKYPSAAEYGLVDPDRGVRAIDRIYTQGDISVSDRRDLGRAAGGSDHGMITWDVAL